MNPKEKIKKDNLQKLSLYRDYLRANPKLAYLFVELTDRCNLHCKHCGSSCSQANKRLIDTNLLIHTLRTVAEDFDASSIMICFTGGEPLLHPDFIQVVRETVQLGFCWGITTNAMLINKAIASEMKRLGLQTITISVDGLERMHDWLRNQQGCFRKTVKVIKMLNEVGIPIQVTTVVHKKNISELECLYHYLCELNIISWRIINVEPIGRAIQKEELLLSRAEFIKMLDFIREKRFSRDTKMDVRYGCSHYLSFEYEHEVRDHYFFCEAGISVASILCNGDIFACLDIERRKEWMQGNIRSDRFSEVWRNRFQVFRQDRTHLSVKCLNCNEKNFCCGDSLHTWNFDTNEPLFCVLREGLYEND